MWGQWRVLTVLLFVTGGLQGQVRVWQGTLTLPTYEEGMPDPNPPFDQFAADRFNYPYTLRNNITSRRVDHAWRAVYLENEYLKCSVLPDIGGHLYTCIDKISGKPMFYANPSIKKAAIAYRGAWAAFGIEFNFPVSHNWVSMSPVNYVFSQHTDGSASVIVGNIDRVYGMEWTVELILRPKSTVLEQRVTLSNRSDVRHRFYWWNNAGVQVWDDSRIEYPMRFVATHGFTEVHPWPVDQDGIDYSLIRNQTKGPVSMFMHGSREGFTGVWNPHSNAGTVHFAEYAEVPAKKIWSWGVDADGLDWRKALSDNDSGYVEVQAGLFRNQETYAFLEPRKAIRFSEYWMPVREIGGISQANLAGVASLKRSGDSLIAGFNANQAVSQATVFILHGKQQLFHGKLDLTPEHAWTHEIRDVEPQAKYTIEIRDAQGTTLLRQTEGVYDWTPEGEIRVGPQPAYHIPEPEKRSYDDWIELGKDHELNGRVLEALDAYKEALRRFPDGFSAQKSAGRVATTLLRFEEARDFLEAVHHRDTSDPEIAYYLGLAYDGVGDTKHAQTAYEQAERTAFEAAAALRLGELLARTGDFAAAERHLAKAVGAAPDDPRVHEELIAAKAAAGKTQEARTLAQGSLARFPLSYFLHEELGDPDLMFLANDPYRILNIAAQYVRLGLYQKALGVLTREYPSATPAQSEPGIPAPGDHPLTAYYRGYCREKLGTSGTEDYKTASSRSTAYVFPNTDEDLVVLRAALRANPADATAHYLLGTHYFSHGLTDAALPEWAEARKSNPRLPVMDASTGLALLHMKHDPEGAVTAFRAGFESDPSNVAIYLGIDQSLSILGRPARERVEALEKYPQLAEAPTALIFELMLNLAEAGDFDRAIGLFHNRFFAREEGGTNVRQVWMEVQLQRSLALAKQAHCAEALDGVQHLGAEVQGLAFTRDGLEPILQSARTNYLLGSVYAGCGKSGEGHAKFKLAAARSAVDETRWAWLAAQKLPGYDPNPWQDRLRAALAEMLKRAQNSSYPGWWLYSAGELEKDLGHGQEAELKFRATLLLPDRMLAYHFTRLAQSKATP